MAGNSSLHAARGSANDEFYTQYSDIEAEMNAIELEKLMGFAPGELEETAAAYESGEWPSGRTVRLGRSSCPTRTTPTPRSASSS